MRGTCCCCLVCVVTCNMALPPRALTAEVETNHLPLRDDAAVVLTMTLSTQRAEPTCTGIVAEKERGAVFIEAVLSS